MKESRGDSYLDIQVSHASLVQEKDSLQNLAHKLDGVSFIRHHVVVHERLKVTTRSTDERKKTHTKVFKQI